MLINVLGLLIRNISDLCRPPCSFPDFFSLFYSCHLVFFIFLCLYLLLNLRYSFWSPWTVLAEAWEKRAGHLLVHTAFVLWNILEFRIFHDFMCCSISCKRFFLVGLDVSRKSCIQALKADAHEQVLAWRASTHKNRLVQSIRLCYTS